MKRIRWAPVAAEDMQEVCEYLRAYNPSLVATTIRKLHAAVRSLRRFPDRGRIGRLEGTRELVLTPLPFIIVYGTAQEVIHVFRIMHSSRDWPR